MKATREAEVRPGPLRGVPRELEAYQRKTHSGLRREKGNGKNSNKATSTEEETIARWGTNGLTTGSQNTNPASSSDRPLYQDENYKEGGRCSLTRSPHGSDSEAQKGRITSKNQGVT